MPRIVFRHLGGPDDQTKKLCDALRRDSVKLKQGAGDAPNLSLAVGYWLNYFGFASMIGPWEDSELRTEAHDLLDHAHVAACQVLLDAAIQLGVANASTITASGAVCRRWYNKPTTKSYGRHYDTWPDCLGSDLEKMPDVERKLVLDGEAAIQELATRVAITANAIITPARRGSAGRRNTTADLARFANTRRKHKPPMKWQDILLEYVAKHPDATDAKGNPLTWEIVRGAWSRAFGAKSKSAPKRKGGRNSE